jgi:replicative DNA helicase
MKSNPQTEVYLIGAMLQNPASDAALEAIELVRVSHFTDERNQMAWQAITDMMNKGQYIDHGTVDNWISVNLNQDLFTYLGSCTLAAPSSAGIRNYAKTVSELGKLREAETMIHRALNCLAGSGDANSRINSAMTELSKIGSSDGDNGFVNPFDAIIKLYERMELTRKSDGGIVGLPSGFEHIDRLTNGFFGGQLIIVAARPGVGKTSLTMNMAENMAFFSDKPKNVLYISLEMPAEQLIMKTASNYQSIHLSDIIRGTVLDPANIEGISRFGSVVEMVKRRQAHLLIDEKSSQHIVQLQARAKRAKIKMGGLDCIFVDYLGLVSADGENQVVRIARVSAGLKQLAKDLNVPVIALSQFNRNITGEPTMSNLRDSGNIEQDADVIMLLHDEDHGKERNEHSLTKCIIAKNRLGQTGECYLQPQLKYSRFVSTDRVPEPPIQKHESQGSMKRYSGRSE